MLTAQGQHPGTLGRVSDRVDIANQLINTITTTMVPILRTSLAPQDELSTSSEVLGISEHGEQPQSTLESVQGLFEHLGTSTDCTALINALVASFSVILVSELGDKTFIITAIMAMKNSRLLVFISSALALLMMTILSVVMGVAVTVVPKKYTHYASIVLFLCFGLKMMKEAYDMDAAGEPESEFEEVEKSLEKDESGPEKEEEVGDKDSSGDNDQPSIVKKKEALKSTLYIAPLVIKVFTMIFVAEWGDRSQISTVILAAREDVIGVFIGSLSGHILCTGLAVLGGRFVAEIISVRTMTWLGGLIFLFFATFAVVMGPD